MQSCSQTPQDVGGSNSERMKGAPWDTAAKSPAGVTISDQQTPFENTQEVGPKSRGQSWQDLFLVLPEIKTSSDEMAIGLGHCKDAPT